MKKKPLPSEKKRQVCHKHNQELRAILKREKEQRQKEDKRRFLLIGKHFYQDAVKNNTLKALYERVSTLLKRDYERALFNLLAHEDSSETTVSSPSLEEVS